MTNLIDTVIFAFFVLVITGLLPSPNHSILLRLVHAPQGVRDWRYQRAWLRRRAWESRHPLGTPREP